MNSAWPTVANIEEANAQFAQHCGTEHKGEPVFGIGKPLGQ